MSRLPRKSLSSRWKWRRVSCDREPSTQKGLAYAGEPATIAELADSVPYRGAIAPDQRLHQAAIIMPVYNEQTGIGETLDAVLDYC